LLQRQELLLGLAYLKRRRFKQVITLDLKKRAGRALFLRLIAHVAVENFRPGASTVPPTRPV